MDNGPLIGALAIFTIGAALVIAIFFLARFMSDPTNRDHAMNVAADGKSATTRVAEQGGAGSDTSLRERLDDASAGDDELRSKEISKKRAANPDNPKQSTTMPTG